MTTPRTASMALARLGIFLSVGLTLLAILSAAIGLGGFPIGASLRALLFGALGSMDAVFSATFVRATPLLLAGLAVAIAFRAGVMNIGAEGQLLIGASAATGIGVMFSPTLGNMTLPVELIAAALAGMLWALTPAWLRHRHGVLEVISTIMMNFLAIHLTSYLVRGPLQEPTRIYPQSPSLPDIARLPQLFSGTRLHWGFVLAILLSLGLAWVMRYSAIGFRIFASGASPTAAREAGRINVSSLTARVFLLSGALAGLAGGVQVAGVTFALYDNISPGYGYTAIAVALLAQTKPVWVIPSSILFGALDAGATAMQRDAGVPAGFVSFTQALVMLSLLSVPLLVDRLVSRRSLHLSQVHLTSTAR